MVKKETRCRHMGYSFRLYIYIKDINSSLWYFEYLDDHKYTSTQTVVLLIIKILSTCQQ